MNISLAIITKFYFSFPKSQIKFNALPNNENSQQRELQNIAINHSADIDSKVFLKIYRNCTRELHYFLTIHTTLPTDNPMGFRNNF